jgi:hypothetical protein
MTKKSKPFRMALAVWVAPDYSAVMAGRGEPPRINHSSVDFKALRGVLVEAFPSGPRVEIIVPNDTIDQVTVQTRAGTVKLTGIAPARSEDELRCADFGKALLACVDTSVDGVANVRAAWKPFHARPVQDRDFAPPPTIVPFVVIAEDFEDAQIWQANCRPVFGLPVFDVLAAALGQSQGDDKESKLPESIRQGLGKIFGTPFQSAGLLDRLAMDQLPSWVG